METGKITDADIALNDTILTHGERTGEWTLDTMDCPLAEGDLDVEAVVAHELGHALGIAHTQVTTDCPTMNAAASCDECSTSTEALGERTLAADDIAAYHFIYDEVRPKPIVLRVPDTFRLDPASPNPFNPETAIRFRLPSTMDVRLEIYNSVGQYVRVLVEEEMEKGAHSVVKSYATPCHCVLILGIDSSNPRGAYTGTRTLDTARSAHKRDPK